MTPSRRHLLVQLWTAAFLAGVIRCAAQVAQSLRRDPRRVAFARRIDVNRAGVPELATLPGVGRERARAIVLHRVRHGPFHALDELGQIDGIGPTTLAALRPFLVELPAAAPR